jgi:hypothetical protein
MFVRLEVVAGQFGMSAIHIPCHAIRDYFFVTDREKPWGSQISFYRLLHVPQTVRFCELRLAYRVRRMEFRQAKAQKSEVAVLERAYNMLADPELRAVYGTLLSNPETPTPFPYSGFGSVLVEGEQAKEGDVFFARRILAFLPELRRHTLTLPLRKLDSFGDYAVLRDAVTARNPPRPAASPFAVGSDLEPMAAPSERQHRNHCRFCAHREVPKEER